MAVTVAAGTAAIEPEFGDSGQTHGSVPFAHAADALASISLTDTETSMPR